MNVCRREGLPCCDSSCQEVRIVTPGMQLAACARALSEGAPAIFTVAKESVFLNDLATQTLGNAQRILHSCLTLCTGVAAVPAKQAS